MTTEHAAVSRPRRDTYAAPASFGAKPIEVSPEGFRVYRGVAAFGDVCLEYGPADPGGERIEFVPTASAMGPDVAATIIGQPFTIHHPAELLDASNGDDIKDAVEGTIIAARADLTKNPPELVVDVKVWTREAQEAIESGRVCNLSPGYNCPDAPAPPGAVAYGKPYTVVQGPRRYNHLSGVITARGVAPDGRRARLDESASPAAYAHDVEEDIAVIADTDAPAEVVTTAPAMDPAEVLAAFSPEAAEILKTLPPEDLAVLTSMALIAKGEAVEKAVVEGAEVEVESTEVEAAEAATAGEEVEDAADAAPPALTMDAVKQMIADALAGFAPTAPAADAAPPAPRADAAPVAPATAAVDRARIEAEVRAERDFVDAMRRRGARCDSAAEATSHALGVVKASDPALLPIAEEAARTGRRDHLLTLFAAADDKRRGAILEQQQATLLAVNDADDEYRQTRLDAANSPARPAYLDFGGPVPGPANPAA